MKKIAIFMATALVLSLSAVAYAQSAGNTYTVDAKTSSTKAGSKSKPTQIGIDFDFTVNGPNGERPGVIESYAIFFGGVKSNYAKFAKCSVTKMESEGGVEGCPKGSIVGTGFIKNATGIKTTPSDRSIQCNAQLWVVNSGGGKGAIFVKGSPTSSDPKTKCAIPLASPIPTTFKNSSKGTTLTFTVPQTLKHPAPTLDNAVIDVDTKINSKKTKGKAFYESIGGCKAGKREVSVTFTTEAGAKTTEKTTAKCSK
jgi:hypothetical protein